MIIYIYIYIYVLQTQIGICRNEGFFFWVVDFINVLGFVTFSAVKVVQILATIKEHKQCSLLKER